MAFNNFICEKCGKKLGNIPRCPKCQPSAKDIRKAAGKRVGLTAKQIKSELDNLISDLAAKLPKELNDRLCELRDRI